MAGDFNEEPQNEPIAKYMKIEKGFEDLYSLKELQKGEEANENEMHPPFTTYKYREKDKGWVKRTIDYIFIK